MATVTISSAENIIFEDAGATPITVTINETSNIAVESRIDGFIVDQGGAASVSIGVGDIIRGVLNDRYIIAKVTALPYTDEANLTFYYDTL